MHLVYLDWENLKSEILSKAFPINYKKIEKGYEVFVVDRNILWTSNVTSEEDKIDFENNYKAKCNKCFYDESGKELSRTESRPLDTTTYFTGRGDSAENLGDGKIFSWDFTNDDDLISAPEGYVRKRIEFRFLDTVWIKEGTLYFYDMPKGSYADVYVVCPAGMYYYDNTGNPKQATEDTIIAHYVNHHGIEGTVPMGDELNTECCSSGIPNYYKFWIDVTIPNEESTNAHGNFEIEMYRERTRIL